MVKLHKQLSKRRHQRKYTIRSHLYKIQKLKTTVLEADIVVILEEEVVRRGCDRI